MEDVLIKGGLGGIMIFEILGCGVCMLYFCGGGWENFKDFFWWLSIGDLSFFLGGDMFDSDEYLVNVWYLCLGMLYSWEFEDEL